MHRTSSIVLLAIAACTPTRRTAPAATPAPAPARAPAPPSEAPAPVPSRPDAIDPLAGEAAAVVDRQNAAYNRHDTEAFLATYADSVVVQTLGDTVVVRGKAALRESTRAWFAQAPGARTEVVDRTGLGPFVVDRQRVTGRPEGSPIESIGIYEVREGLIRRVWSIPPPPTPR